MEMIKQKVMTERERGYIDGTIATAAAMSKKGESNGNNDDFLTPKRKRNVKS
jgi:hypothetical protein